MFANLLHLFTRRNPPEDYDLAFVKDIRVNPPREVRSRRSERWIAAGWILIGAKCTAMWWAIEAYSVPIHPLWLVGPTLVFGLLATALYVWRD
jgi:hypothetical protein